MAKFNVRGASAAALGAIRSEQRATGRTYEGAPGFARDAKGELFLLAVTHLAAEDTFYESGSDRDARLRALVAGLVERVLADEVRDGQEEQLALRVARPAPGALVGAAVRTLAGPDHAGTARSRQCAHVELAHRCCPPSGHGCGTSEDVVVTDAGFEPARQK